MARMRTMSRRRGRIVRRLEGVEEDEVGSRRDLEGVVLHLGEEGRVIRAVEDMQAVHLEELLRMDVVVACDLLLLNSLLLEMEAGSSGQRRRRRRNRCIPVG